MKKDYKLPVIAFLFFLTIYALWDMSGKGLPPGVHQMTDAALLIFIFSIIVAWTSAWEFLRKL